jgi:ABC-type transporter Mla subunit MlaD
VISIILIIAVIVGIKGAGQFLEPDQIRTAHFKLDDDVSGLNIGDDVRIGGLKVGIVRSAHIEQKEDGAKVILTFNIPERYTLREGAHIAVQGTVTGTAWLNFDDLGKGKPLAEDHVLAGSPSALTTLSKSIGELGPEIQRLASDLRTITVPKVNKTVDSVGVTFDTARSKVDTVMSQYVKVTDRLDAVFAELRDILGDTKPDIRRLMANLAAATETLKTKLPPALDAFDSVLKKINEELQSTSGVLVELRKTAANAREVSGSARSLLVTNRSKIDDMVTSLHAASENLKYATAEIRHSPWRLLYKPKAGEAANLNLFDATRHFAEGANDLSNAASALRDALNDPQADKAKIEQLVNKLDDSFNDFQKVEGDLWKRVKD